jgi:SNF2 family DNA or RNA helicase
MKKALKNGWSNKSCPLKVFAMTNVSPLTVCNAGDLAEADVVLCSYRILFSPIYQDRRKEILGKVKTFPDDEARLRDLVIATRRFLSGDCSLRSGRKGDKEVRNWKDLEFPVLEMFYWRRVVFDEFHELESFESTQQNSLQHMRSHYRWGLTGTPPVGWHAGAIFMSSLFRIDLPGAISNVNIYTGCPDLSKWEGDKLLSEVAARFLDHTVRQNTAELPHIALEEHVIFVQHSATERALYLGQAHDAPDMSRDDSFSSEANRQSLERLLKLCSHFQAVGDHVTSAKDECTRIGEQKEKRFVKASNQLQRCARVIHLLRGKLSDAGKSSKIATKITKALAKLDDAKEKLASEGTNGVEVRRLFDEISLEVQEEDSEKRIGFLSDHKPKDQDLWTTLGADLGNSRHGYNKVWIDFADKPLPPDMIIHLLAGQAAEQTQNLEEVVEARASYFFFKRTIDALVADDSPSNRACVVCLEEGFPLEQLSITPCAHAFCMPCLTSTVEKFKSCSICRKPLTAKDIRPLNQEIKPAEMCAASSSHEPGTDAPVNEAAAKHGTKLAAVVRKLQELRAEDTTTKVILFVQFDDLKRKVAVALADFGIPAVQLHGSVAQRSNIINDWQNNPNSQAFVLLLSLAQSASGANLTAAGHVVFLHPMLAPSAETAIGYELQAIGRARRHGQKRNTVHVHRFVTVNTIEQSITERHQAALWERESARREKELANDRANADENVDDFMADLPA